jgi:hypothetical protein
MNAEFNWWLLIVGLVIGASLTWLVMAETTRREADVAETERRSEALWISTILERIGRSVPTDRVEEVLRLHREYLAAPPPDEPDEPAEAEAEPRAMDASGPAEPTPGDATADSETGRRGKA